MIVDMRMRKRSLVEEDVEEWTGFIWLRMNQMADILESMIQFWVPQRAGKKNGLRITSIGHATWREFIYLLTRADIQFPAIYDLRLG
jgi:hypothetical protein